MACYHPLIGIWKGERYSSGAKKYIIQGGIDPFIRIPTGDGKETIVRRLCPPSILEQVTIPCGQCIGCRLDYSRSWADRMCLEYETSGRKAIFITLTYNDDSADWSGLDPNTGQAFASLNKRDCQLFMKRLRERFEGKEIRFYLSGEYGPNTKRPHYHAIIFGVDLDDFPDKRPFRKNEIGQMWYISDFLTDIWNLGYTLLSDVSYKCFAYVSRYVTKKLNGALASQYTDIGIIPEFSLMSRRPGIGRRYLDLHPDCLDMKNINIPDPIDPIQIDIPKYFLRQLKNENSQLYDLERYDKMCEERRELARNGVLAELQKTNLLYFDYLQQKETQRKLNARKILRRGG